MEIKDDLVSRKWVIEQARERVMENRALVARMAGLEPLPLSGKEVIGLILEAPGVDKSDRGDLVSRKWLVEQARLMANRTSLGEIGPVSLSGVEVIGLILDAPEVAKPEGNAELAFNEENREKLAALLERARGEASDTMGSMNHGFGAWYADYLIQHQDKLMDTPKVGNVNDGLEVVLEHEEVFGPAADKSFYRYGIGAFQFWFSQDNTNGNLYQVSVDNAAQNYKGFEINIRVENAPGGGFYPNRFSLRGRSIEMSAAEGREYAEKYLYVSAVLDKIEEFFKMSKHFELYCAGHNVGLESVLENANDRSKAQYNSSEQLGVRTEELLSK